VIKQLIHNFTTGCTDSTTQTIIISRMDAGFTLSNDTVCNFSQVTINSTSTFSDPAATFVYNMGDGNVVMGDPISYNYLTSGPHVISLTATNAAGCADSMDLPILVLDPPLAVITASDVAGCLPINPVYSNFSVPQGNGVALSSFLWTFPDLTTQTTNSIATTTNFNYTTEGSFTTTLVATDVFGCVSPPASAAMLITNPTVNFIMDPVVCDLENFIAANTSTGFGNLSYTWNIDNVFNTNNTDVLNFFDEVENPLATNVPHTVSLIVTDGNGCIDSTSQVIRVSMPIANLSYVASGATANSQGEFTCPPVFETYTDLTSSYGTISSWSWNFGDGKTSAFQSPNNTYVFPGTYTLSLSIVDQYGCTSDTSLVDYLTILGPGGDLNWTSVGDLCEHLFTFSATNLTFVDSIVWDMNDGNLVFDSTSFTYQYPVGTYNPTGTLIDSLGCEVTYPIPVLVVNAIVIGSNAGPDQAFCGDNTSMAGNVDPNGSGLWTLISGAGIITDPSLATTTITGLGIGVNTFEWKVFNNCDTIRDTMKITVTGASTPALAGLDQIICATSTTLDGNFATTGVGTWTLFSGAGTITTPSDSLTTITGLGVGVNQFVWTIGNVCNVESDIVSITVEVNPTLPLAGPDQNACIPNTVMAANPVVVGVGTWTLISGTGIITDVNSPVTTITGLPLGPNVFVWTITNSCGTNSDTVIITGVDAPTTSDAGPDQFICIDNTTLAGNEPLNGVGVWSLVSGTGVINVPTDFGTTVSGLSVGPNVFEWTITSLCGVSTNQVTITIETTPTIALAGIDSIACSNSVNLTANAVGIGTGIWTLSSGSGIIANPNGPNTLITGLGLGQNTFLWTISNSCSTTSDPVNIRMFNMPTIPDAGLNRPICSDPYTLSGNIPVEGVGSWSVISGTGVFTDPLDPGTTVSGLSVGPNVFHWTITNACGAPFDPVTITLETPPTIASVGDDQMICGHISQLDGIPNLIGTGVWTLISGSGSILLVNDSTSVVSNLGVGENVFEWTISNTCSTSSAQMTINITGECPDEDSIANILYFFVPNAFTPNEDDFNQMFLPIFTGGYDHQNYSLFIYDRWGEIVFESHDADKGWLGRYGVDGVLVQDDTYTWKIIFTDTDTETEHTLVGHVNVLK
jgi:gliding motility-associated-like protein